MTILNLVYSKINRTVSLYKTDILAMDSIYDTESNTTIYNTTMSIINSTDEERNHSSTSGPTNAIHILIQLQQLQIPEQIEPKEETTSKSIHFFPCVILCVLYFLLV